MRTKLAGVKSTQITFLSNDQKQSKAEQEILFIENNILILSFYNTSVHVPHVSLCITGLVTLCYLILSMTTAMWVPFVLGMKEVD